MEIKDFVRESLVQITKAVFETNKELQGTGALANPANVDIKNVQDVYGRYMSVSKDIEEREPVVLLVDFNLAVHAQERKQKEGEAGIAVSVLHFGGKGASEESSGSESRINFSIPLLLPRGGLQEQELSG